MNARVKATKHRPLQIMQSEARYLIENPNNARIRKPKQIGLIAESIRKFGFTNPILIDGSGNILAGHARLAAAKLVSLRVVPTICISHLTPAEQRAYMIADNRLGDLCQRRSDSRPSWRSKSRPVMVRG